MTPQTIKQKMGRFLIAQKVTKLLPKMQVVVVTAYNLDNHSENRSVDAFASDTASATVSDLSAYPNAQSHPRIALYRDTLKAACNLSPKKFPQSHESLYRRLVKEKRALPPINPLVDFYNAVSVKHGVTAGAFDLAELQTHSTSPLELRLSAAAAARRAACARPARLAGLCPGRDSADEALGVAAGRRGAGHGEDTGSHYCE
ncbi:MAG: hypothetical protein Q9173_003069 [Seirophora scorigena]